MTSTELWTSYGSYSPTEKVEITANVIQSSSSTENYGDNYFKNAHVEFISDNLNNFDTICYPYSPIRKKPFVLRLNKEYLMFTHKLKNTIYIAEKNETYQQNIITLSRGFTNNLFGEESSCFPKYTYQSLDDIIPNAISFENPCVIDLQNGLYRMYFNVKLYNKENGFSTEIYKADTVDFESWYNYEKVIMNYEN